MPTQRPPQQESARINTIQLVAASIRGDVAAVKRIIDERDVDVNAADAVRSPIPPHRLCSLRVTV